MSWDIATDDERRLLFKSFQRSARHRGKLPDAVLVQRQEGWIVRSAMQYIEPGKWERWGIQRHPADDICESWSQVMGWLSSLIGRERSAIEVYPHERGIRNTAPIRWFWVIPGHELPQEYDLSSHQTQV